MAAEIRARFPDAEVKMIPSSGGRFEVFRDGEAVYRKSVTRRHPEPGEILELLKKTSPDK